MNTTSLRQWGGWLMVLGGLLLGSGVLAHPAETAANVGTTQWAISHYGLLLSLIVGLPGVTALYLTRVEATGMLGVVGYAAVFIGMYLFGGITYYEAFFSPALAEAAPAFIEGQVSGSFPGALNVILPFNGIIYAVGWLLLGWAFLRDGRLPRIASAAVLIGGVTLGLAPILPAILFTVSAVLQALGLVGLGLTLVRATEHGEMPRAKLAT